ncbi:hypothetical protein D3C72_505200 [compost metagenome]
MQGDAARDLAAQVGDERAHFDIGKISLDDAAGFVLTQFAGHDAAADAQVDTHDPTVAVQGDDGGGAGGEGDLAHAAAAAQGDSLGRTFARILARAVELDRRGAADIGGQGEGQALQRALPLERQAADHPGRAGEADVASGDVEDGALIAAAVGQAHPAIGLARSQEGALTRGEGHIRAGGIVVGQGDGALGGHAAGVDVHLGQAKLLAAEEEVARGAGRAVVGTGVEHDAPVRGVGALAEAEDQVGVGQDQTAGRDLVKGGAQVGARLGQGAGQGAVAAHGAVDGDGADAERAAGVPVQGQAHLAALDQALGAHATGGAGQFAPVDGQDALVVGAGHGQTRSLAQQPIQFVHAEAQTRTASVEADGPGSAARLAGLDRALERTLGAGADARDVGDVRIAPEIQAAGDAAAARAGQDQTLAAGVDLLQQIGAVDGARALQLDARRRAQKGADDACIGAACSANVGDDVEPALVGGHAHRARDPGGAIAGDIGREQAGRALKRPGFGVALEHAGIGRGARQGAADQAAKRGGGDLQADAVRGRAVAEPDEALGAGLDVVSGQGPGHALEAFAGLVRRGGEAEAGGATDPLDEGREQVRAREVRIAADARAVLAVAALDRQGREVPGLDLDVDQFAVDHGDGGEGLVRGIAQGPGDRSALGLAGAQVDAQVLGVLADDGLEQQVVALAVQAEGVDVDLLVALARDFGVADQRPAAVLLGEVFHQFDVGAELVDVDGDGLRAARLGAGLQQRAADDADLVGADLGRMEAAHQQGPIGPVDVDIGRLKPDAVRIRDRDPAQGEVVEKVALQALDIDAAIAADLLARDKASHQFAARIGDQIHPPADGGDDSQGNEGGDHDARDEGDQLQARALALRRLRGRVGGAFRFGFVRRRSVGQNAWPMLM